MKARWPSGRDDAIFWTLEKHIQQRSRSSRLLHCATSMSLSIATLPATEQYRNDALGYYERSNDHDTAATAAATPCKRKGSSSLPMASCYVFPGISDSERANNDLPTEVHQSFDYGVRSE